MFHVEHFFEPVEQSSRVRSPPNPAGWTTPLPPLFAWKLGVPPKRTAYRDPQFLVANRNQHLC